MLHMAHVSAAAMRRAIDFTSRSSVLCERHAFTICGMDAKAPRVIATAAKIYSINVL